MGAVDSRGVSIMWGWRECGNRAVQRNCEYRMMHEGCKNNERDSDSNTRVRDLSITFYHHKVNKVDGEVQGTPSRLCKYGDICPPIAAGPKAIGR